MHFHGSLFSRALLSWRGKILKGEGFALEKTEALRELLRGLGYYGRVLGRWQGVSRWYGEDVLLCAGEAELLAEIGDRQPVTARELARMKVSTPSAISQMVKRLDEKGLLEKQAREDDRRAIGLSLSPRGRQVYDRHRARREEQAEAWAEALADYTPEDIARAGELVGFLTQRYLEELLALDM